jgi:hypothetical protein
MEREMSLSALAFTTLLASKYGKQTAHTFRDFTDSSTVPDLSTM